MITEKLIKTSNLWRCGAICGNIKHLSSQAQLKNIYEAEALSHDLAEAKPFESVPGPTKFQFIRSFMPGGECYGRNLLDLSVQMRAKYGDIYKWPPAFGKRAMLFTCSPEDFRMIYRTEGQWPIRRGLDMLDYYRRVVRKDVYGKTTGLVQEQGEPWGEFRSNVNPVLMNPKTFKQYVPQMDKVAKQFVERIKNIRDRKTLEVPQNFEKELNNWAMESVCLVALDTEMGLINNSAANPKAREVIDGMRKFLELLVELDMKPSIWRIIPTRDFKQIISVLDKMTDLSAYYIDEAIERLNARKERGQPPKPQAEQSVLERLLSIDRSVAIVMAMDMVQFGGDTTTSAFAGALLSVASDLEKQEKLRKEMRTIMPTKNSPLTSENMHNLPYLRACIKEAMRLYPVTPWLSRTTGQDVVLSGYSVPKGTDIIMPYQLLLTDETYYKRPTEFLPERWLRNGEQLDASGCPMNANSPFVFLPFGFGPRTCIGKRLVDQEMETLLARLVRNFEIRFERDLDGIFTTNMINVPNKPLQFKFVDVQD